MKCSKAKASEKLFSMTQTPMDQGLLKSSATKTAPKSTGTPQVKSSKTCNLFNAGVSVNLKTAKSADPTCYDVATVNQDRTSEGDMDPYREAIKKEARSGYAGNREMERHPAYVAKDRDTIAIATKYGKSAYDVATDIIAVRLSSRRTQ